MNKVLFKEEQQFRQWWWIVLMLVSTVPVMIFSIFALYQQTVRGIQVGDNPAPNWALILIFFSMIGVDWLYFIMKLEVWVDQEGVHYRFFPLIFKYKIIRKEEIERYEIRKYNAIFDYGGWGIRRGFGRKWGRAYIISGNSGLQLYLKNGKKVLFGTQRSQALMYVMDEIMNQKR